MGEEDMLQPFMDPKLLVQLVEVKMPYGKYAGRALIDLPEPYLIWFSQKGFPEDELGKLLELTYVIKANGLEYLIRPLKKRK